MSAVSARALLTGFLGGPGPDDERMEDEWFERHARETRGPSATGESV